MKKIEKILVPTDFSENSIYALGYAKYFAKSFGARLYILHVIHEILGITNFYAPHISVEKIEGDMFNVAEYMMEKLCMENLPELNDYEPAVVIGLPPQEIIRVAEEKGIDMIVMGTHGRSVLEKAIFGNTAEKVVKNAPCPVLTVRQPEREAL